MLPLVMLPGMMCTGELFRAQISHFSAERTVLVMSISEHRSMYSLAKDVLNHAPPTFALCGLSMGGIVALEVLRQAPERVKGLALLDSNAFAELHSTKQKRDPQIVKVRAGGLLDVMRDEMIPHYLADRINNSELVALCSSMALQLGSDVFERQSLALRDRPDQSATLKSVQVPTLFLCGEHDKLCPVERHQLMQKMVAGSTLAVVADAAHLPVLEQPRETNRHLQAWLLACDRREASSALS